MKQKLFFTWIIILFHIVDLRAQKYKFENLEVEIVYKNLFEVRNFHDLDVEIVYKIATNSSKSKVYQSLVNSNRSTFGNCYFELFRFDSSKMSYENISFDFVGTFYPLRDLNKEEILRYDIKKAFLKKGESKKLVFNLLNFIPMLKAGRYVFKIYLRCGSLYGFNKSGKISTNSIFYLESEFMNFEVVEEIKTPNLIH